jgi:hypothetical protein
VAATVVMATQLAVGSSQKCLQAKVLYKQAFCAARVLRAVMNNYGTSGSMPIFFVLRHCKKGNLVQGQAKKYCISGWQADILKSGHCL